MSGSQQGLLNVFPTNPNFHFAENAVLNINVDSPCNFTVIDKLPIPKDLFHRRIYFFGTTTAALGVRTSVFGAWWLTLFFGSSVVSKMRLTNINQEDPLPSGQWKTYRFSNVAIAGDTGRENPIILKYVSNSQGAQTTWVLPFNVTCQADRASVTLEGTWNGGNIDMPIAWLGIYSSSIAP